MSPERNQTSEPTLGKDELYAAVTDQIMRAQHAEDALGIDSIRVAWSEVSATEELIADIGDISDIERNIARRGAISAAKKSGNIERVTQLTLKYGIDQETDV